MAPAINSPLLPHLADDPIWRATFRGFFWGEGWLGIDMYKNRRHGRIYTAHRPAFNISQANSNVAVVYHIQDVLGGTVYTRKSDYGSRGARDLPVHTWMARSNSLCMQVYDILTEEKFFPDKKLETKLVAFGKFLALVEELNGRSRGPEVLAEMTALRQIVSPACKVEG